MSLEIANKLFETNALVVYHNGSGEVFIKNKSSDVTIRVSDGPTSNQLQITAGNGRGFFSPWAINGLPAILVTKEK